MCPSFIQVRSVQRQGKNRLTSIWTIFTIYLPIFLKVLTAIDDDSKSSNSLSNLTKGLLMSEDKLNGDIFLKEKL